MPQKTMRIENIPLREKKYAKTKLDLLKAFYERLKTQNLDEISVKELCKDTNISYKTFFNYFSKKTDLLVYFMHLWTVEAQYKAENLCKDKSPLETIETIFDFTVDKYEENYTIVREIVSYLALNREILKFSELTEAEYLLAFPKSEGIEKFKPCYFDDIMMPLIEMAVEKGELGKNTDKKITLLTLRSIFFGVILSIQNGDAKVIRETYQKQLDMVWNQAKK